MFSYCPQSFNVNFLRSDNRIRCHENACYTHETERSLVLFRETDSARKSGRTESLPPVRVRRRARRRFVRSARKADGKGEARVSSGEKGISCSFCRDLLPRHTPGGGVLLSVSISAMMYESRGGERGRREERKIKKGTTIHRLVPSPFHR